MEPDELLIKKIIKGDHEAFGSIVENYKALIYIICFNIVKDCQEAENLAQETFIKAYSSLSQYKYGSFKTWIARIATNTSIDYKRSVTGKRQENVVYIEDIDEITKDESVNIQEEFIKKEQKEKVLQTCNQLPEKYKTVLIKYYIESKNYNEIANEEKISTRAVETRLYRAKKLFKRRWDEGEHYEPF
ncbi:MAG: RNA polymerase sigma factor [Deltaproteobacteria bacterium]